MRQRLRTVTARMRGHLCSLVMVRRCKGGELMVKRTQRNLGWRLASLTAMHEVVVQARLF